MQSRINSILKTLWEDIRTALNDNQQGIDLAKLEALLSIHSRVLLAELGKSNIPVLPPTVVENAFNYFLPQGINPLIHSLLSYLKVEAPNDSLYLDPLNTIKLATQKLRMLLEDIAQQNAVGNLAWLQYTIYQEAIRAWQEIVEKHFTQVKQHLEKNKAYLYFQQALIQQFGGLIQGLNNWLYYADELKTREAALTKIREQFSNTSSFPDCFYSIAFETWKQLLWFNPEEEQYFANLWLKRENLPQPLFQSGKNMLVSAIRYTGLQKGTWYLKTDKQIITELIDQHLVDTREAINDCQKLIAISQAKAAVITPETMIDAQIRQLHQLEIYFTSVLSKLYAYVDNQNTVDDHKAFLLKVKAWLGFKKAVEESNSTTELATLKGQAFTKISHSTLNILHAIARAQSSLVPDWTTPPFQNIKSHLDNLHKTIDEEVPKLTTAINKHNKQFCNEWNFWPRKKVLNNLLESIAKNCPVKYWMP